MEYMTGKKVVVKPKRKMLFINETTHEAFKKSANKADRKYDPHLLRITLFYEKWKGKHPDDE